MGSIIGGNFPQASQPKIKIDPNDLDEFKCSECESNVFQQAVKLKKLSALQSSTGNKSIVPVPVFICVKCQKELTIE